MAQSSGLTWVLIAGAAYVAYEYFLAPAAATTTTTTGGGTSGGSTGGTSGGTTGGSSGSSTTTNIPNVTLSACGGTGQPVCTPAITLALLMNGVAGGSATNIVKLDIDQWAYYYDQMATPLSGDQVNAIIAAAGITAANRSTVTMNAAQFLALASGIGVAGLSGYGGRGYARRIAVPALAARGFGHFTLGDLRRAGGR